MRYLLDSNIIIAGIMGSNPALGGRLADCDDGDLVTSAVVYAEVAHGSSQGKPPPPEILDAFLEDIPVLPFDRAAADVYASLPFVRGSYDRLIAAHAVSQNLAVITRNTRQFVDIPGLKIEDWTSPL